MAWLPGLCLLSRGQPSPLPQAPLPAQQAQQAVQQMPLPPAAPVPAWVQRARQGPDVTQALVAAAADCPHVPLPNTWRQQRQQECEPAPVPGWLAYRVAGVLPESAGCHHAADVLRVGAAAAAAAAADAEADGSEERQQAGAQPAGNGSQQQQLDLSQLAARLVAGLTMQEEPYADLEDRSMHLFSHRNSALHRKLKRHLAPLLGGSTAGGSRRPRIPGGRQPSRLRLPGAGDAAAGDAGEGAAAAAGAASEAAAAAAAAAQPFTGVRTTAEGRFTACLYVRNEQLWLGSYAEVEAVSGGWMVRSQLNVHVHVHVLRKPAVVNLLLCKAVMADSSVRHSAWPKHPIPRPTLGLKQPQASVRPLSLPCAGCPSGGFGHGLPLAVQRPACRPPRLQPAA